MTQDLQKLTSIPKFRDYEPDAFPTAQSVYTAIREVPGFPAVYVGRRVFIDMERWEQFKKSGGKRLAGGWRKEAA